MESASVATALAKNDLPVPGGPYNRIPLNGFLCPVNNCGNLVGSMTVYKHFDECVRERWKHIMHIMHNIFMMCMNYLYMKYLYRNTFRRHHSHLF